MVTTSAPQAFALAEHNAPSKSWLNRCQEFVRTALGLPGGAASAGDAYQQAKARGAVHSGRNPPANVPVYFDVANPNEHVALSAGGGMVWSNDIERSGKIDLVPITTIEQKWGATYLGWGTYVNGTTLPVLDANGNPANPANPIFQSVGLGDQLGKLPGPLGDVLGGAGGKVDDAADAARKAAERIAEAPARWVEEHIVRPAWVNLRKGAITGAFVVLGIGLVYAGAASLARSGARGLAAKAAGG